MRVGLLTADLNPRHGWGQYSLRLLRSLQKQGVEVVAVTADNSPEINDVTTYPLLPSVVPFAPRLSRRLLTASRRVRQVLAGCDLIHSTVEWYAPVGIFAAGKRPSFLTVHGSYSALPQIRPFPLNRIYHYAFQHSTLIAVSHYTAQVVRQIVPQAQISVIPNGVDVERFAAMPLLEDRPSAPVILSSGGVKVRKGTMQLVQAVAEVRKQIPDIRCVIIGTLAAEPNYVRQVYAEIERLQLEDHVQLTGFVDQETLDYWYATARLFALPSINDDWKFEGFGLVNLEASAAGLPVIGTTGCGAADAVTDGVTGLLVSQERIAQELPQAILSLLNDPQRSQAMGIAGREKACQQTWDQAAQQVLQLYKQISS